MDLGNLNDPILVFGGPYSNLAATLAIRKRAEALGIPPSRVICTGDLVAYCAEPNEVVDEIRHWGIPVVMGNCEESLANNSADCGCGFESNSTCALLSDSWYRYSNLHISDDNRLWMSSLPREIRFRFAGREIIVVHGAPSSINRFVFPSTPTAEKALEIETSQVDIVIGGHCGIPFGQAVGEGFWLNGGVIGMPANDGTNSAWFMLLKSSEKGCIAEWHRMDYDWQQTQKSMRQAGLINGYAKTLETGLWPSMDVLPLSERRRQGSRMVLEPLNIPTVTARA